MGAHDNSRMIMSDHDHLLDSVSILEREKKNPTLQENEFQSSGQLYISSFLGTHHQTVTK